MEQLARRPEMLSSEGPMDANWRSWKQQFLSFLKVSGCINKDQDIKANLMINFLGPVGQQVLQNLDFDSPSDIENMDIIIEKLDNHYDPKKSEAYERNVFWTSRKKNEDSIDQYVKELKMKAKTCNFGNLADGMIRDKIILDIRDRSLKESLLEKRELNLNQAILFWQAHEPRLTRNNISSSSKTDQSGKKATGNCRRCGTRHPINDCPAWGTKCEKCNGTNHFTQCCSNVSPPQNNSKDNVNTQLKNLNLADGPFNQISAKVMNKDAAFKNNK